MPKISTCNLYFNQKLRWAIAGRSIPKLTSFRKYLSTLNSELSVLPLIKADALDLAQVWQMCSRTRVLVSLVGPFERYGNHVVFSCVQNGTDYCDISQNLDWIRFNIDKYRDKALQTGARLVFASGTSSTCWDMATYLLHEECRRAGDQLCTVEHENDCKTNISGGVLQAMICSIDGENEYLKKKYAHDPLKFTFDRERGFEKNNNEVVLKTHILSRGLGLNASWKIRSPFAECNRGILTLSQAQLGYPSKLIYKEYNTESTIIIVINNFFGLLFLKITLLLRPLREFMLKSSLIPKSGQGPSPNQLSKNYLSINSIATTQKGKSIRLQTMVNEDVAYKANGRTVAESGLCFVFNANKIQQNGGCFTPVSCFGIELKNRLESTGHSFNVINFL